MSLTSPLITILTLARAVLMGYAAYWALRAEPDGGRRMRGAYAGAVGVGLLQVAAVTVFGEYVNLEVIEVVLIGLWIISSLGLYARSRAVAAAALIGLLSFAVFMNGPGLYRIYIAGDLGRQLGPASAMVTVRDVGSWVVGTFGYAALLWNVLRGGRPAVVRGQQVCAKCGAAAGGEGGYCESCGGALRFS